MMSANLNIFRSRSLHEDDGLPKISVVTSVLNSVNTIEDTIKSVLVQTYPRVEHVIADGGSTDGTLDIIKRYADMYPDRIVVSSRIDGGIYEGMNRGLDMAGGDIVGFLNGDDYLAGPDILKHLIVALDDKDVDAVYGDVRYVGRRKTNISLRYYSSEQFRPELMLRGYMPAHPTFYCRRQLYDKFGNYDTSYRLAADFELMLRMIYIGGITTKYLPLECVRMRIGGASNSSIQSILTINREHMRAYRQHNIPNSAIRDASRYLTKIPEFIYHFFR